MSSRRYKRGKGKGIDYFCSLCFNPENHVLSARSVMIGFSRKCYPVECWNGAAPEYISARYSRRSLRCGGSIQISSLLYSEASELIEAGELAMVYHYRLCGHRLAQRCTIPLLKNTLSNEKFSKAPSAGESKPNTTDSDSLLSSCIFLLKK